MGMSRSATSVIMFIMRLFSMKLDDAFEFVKTQREATDPNDGFLEQLRIFEKTDFSFETDSTSEPQSSCSVNPVKKSLNSAGLGLTIGHRAMSMGPSDATFSFNDNSSLNNSDVVSPEKEPTTPLVIPEENVTK